MKRKLRLFSKVIKMFPDGSFYSCTIDDYDMKFQGKYNPDTIVLAHKLRFRGSFDASGYCELTRGDMKILLTN